MLILAYFVMFGSWQRDTVLAANIGKVIDEVANLKKGVYATWHDQPVWSLILYPLGGVTILSFLDFMAGK